VRVTPPKFAKLTEGLDSDIDDDAPIWEADTPVGRFAFGCDLDGIWYWQGCVAFDLGADVATREEAEAGATASYVRAVMGHPVAALFESPL
jgi:hypothetical protein